MVTVFNTFFQQKQLEYKLSYLHDDHEEGLEEEADIEADCDPEVDSEDVADK